MSWDDTMIASLAALEVLPQKGRRRDSVIHLMKGLKNNAHLGGGFQTVDPKSGRPFEVSLVSGFAVTWWIDTPARQILVVDIRPISPGPRG
ncbi:hypothetical protein [Roseibacillus ishigakijimensis]|uniref:Uncharacterized protein n=1 Tax=Roseibacillus ishigakijimensis TaxID=454146 RepID=A0A934RSK2_9BACT|nr:hypothetical protein [Roseibacillus ishigakijimensis]MBK1835152.1 hypothetical protein [Roseibacillus ishigakijimensis]